MWLAKGQFKRLHRIGLKTGSFNQYGSFVHRVEASVFIDAAFIIGARIGTGFS
jgi:hypothetical protein